MVYTFWSIITYIFLPLSVILGGLLSSNVSILESIAQSICKIEFEIFKISFHLPLVVVFICILAFCNEWRILNKLYQQRYHKVSAVEFNEAWRASLWRHQRNWWLALGCVIFWIMVWRLSKILNATRLEIQSLSLKKSLLINKDSTILRKKTKK